MRIIVASIGLLVLLTGCVKSGVRIGDRIAWKAVYATPDVYRTIAYQAVRPISRAGKFVYVNGRIFLVEQGSGIHVVSYADPMMPVKQGFIAVPGCYEVSWNNGYLIANNGPDLISMTLGGTGGVTVASRLPNVFKSIQEAGNIPPDAVSGDYFECPDFSKGVLLRWEKGTVSDPECRVR
jgi:hypothetical protein